MPLAQLSDRAILQVSGPDARTFLDRLVTCDLERLQPASARFGALLTPQGKIISDFIAFEASAIEAETFLIDTASVCAPDLVKRLSMYKLRAKAVVADVTEHYAVLAGWGNTAAPTGERHLAVTDPRLSALGWRAVVERDGLLASGAPTDGEAAYGAHRIALGVPDGGRDFVYGDAFPHEALMDQLGGVDFGKGCYVGQEVVSRMQHRGTARTRIVPVDIDGDAGEGGDVTAGDRTLGRLGSVAGTRGLASLRLDRVADALAAGQPITAGAARIVLRKPDWATFPFPGEGGATAA